MENLILGIDAGNFKAKTVGPYGIDSYRTAICGWFERNSISTYGQDDMEFEIDGKKGFAGTIAAYEDEFGDGSMYGDSKAHEDGKVRVLLAIYRYINKYCPGVQDVSLVTGQPITTHNDEEKLIIQQMLKGTHNIVVNGDRQIIHIRDVKVAVEGGGAFWSLPTTGTIRIIDIGSGVINMATVIDKKFFKTYSDTFNFGIDTVANKNDLEAVSRAIVRGTTRLKWNRKDSVFLCGGIANQMLPHIINHYSYAQLLKPQLKVGDELFYADPVFANAIGFYRIGSNNA